MRSVNLRKVALAQQVREFEDVVLDLLVDGPLGRRLLLFYHYLYNLIISSGNSIAASKPQEGPIKTNKEWNGGSEEEKRTILLG